MPTLPLNVIVGAVVLEHITALPAVIDAVPPTDNGFTFTVALIVAEGHTPFVTTAK